jgi:multimeric flavodoxin WrbA
MDRIYELLLNSDILSISSPVYFSSPSGPLKTLIDRCQTIWEKPMGSRFRRTGRFQRAHFMAAAGSPFYKNMFTPSRIIMSHFFRIIGATWNEKDFILVSGTDTISEIDGSTCERAKELALKYPGGAEGET